MSLGIPEWLFIGLAYAAGATTLVIAAFALGDWEPPSWVLRGGSKTGRARSGGGDWRRRGEVRRYLSAIREPFVEDKAIGGVHCAFYLTERDVAVTFDHDTYESLRSSSTYVVFCEQGMRADQLGDRLPFETPEPARGRQQTRSGSTSRDRRGRHRSRSSDGDHRRRGTRNRDVSRAFRTLGIPRDADVSTVKEAYREKVKEVHPDHGGSEDEFAAIQEAYATAKQHAE